MAEAAKTRMSQGQRGGIKTKKPSVPKSAGGSQSLSRNSTSSLAVFYVEQVALNRHVSPQLAAPTLMTGRRPVVNPFRFRLGNWRSANQGLPAGKWTLKTADLKLSVGTVPVLQK